MAEDSPPDEIAYKVTLCVPHGLEEFADAVLEQKIRNAQLLIDKQFDYGPRNISDFGEYGVLIRLNDKVRRLQNIYERDSDNDPKNESIDDSWADTENYGTIAQMIRAGDWPGCEGIYNEDQA